MSLEIDRHLGVFAATVLTHPDHVRGDHPVNSFTAVGPMAQELIREQSPLDVYAPLQALCDSNGSVVLMGVQLESLTLVHLAERKAGRNLFRRWANGRGGEPIMVETGGCSRGFGRLEPVVAALGRERLVGRSRWRVFPAAATLEAAAHAIRTSPAITHCDDPHCERCNDALLGGPILPPD
jgi:aminoglycoside 3-N-acetyltransferase